jgi:hypothetical protein
MLDMLDAARCRVYEKVLRTANCELRVTNGNGGVAHKVLAMPPVARMPQRIVFGVDMMLDDFEVLQCGILQRLEAL